MKRITLAALTLLLASCRTGTETAQPKDYAALADAAMPTYTITDNDAYGFQPEGQFDAGKYQILAQHKDGDWTVYSLPGKKSGFDTVEVTVDPEGTILRLRFIQTSKSALGRRDAIDSAFQDLRSKYKAVQRIGDADTAELTVYVADSPAEWKQHYIEYLQLMDEPNTLGAQNCWILQPHLSQIQATIRRQGVGSLLTIDFQTKKYAAAVKARTPPPRPAPAED